MHITIKKDLYCDWKCISDNSLTWSGPGKTAFCDFFQLWLQSDSSRKISVRHESSRKKTFPTPTISAAYYTLLAFARVALSRFTSGSFRGQSRSHVCCRWRMAPVSHVHAQHVARGLAAHALANACPLLCWSPLMQRTLLGACQQWRGYQLPCFFGITKSLLR